MSTTPGPPPFPDGTHHQHPPAKWLLVGLAVVVVAPITTVLLLTDNGTEQAPQPEAAPTSSADAPPQPTSAPALGKKREPVPRARRPRDRRPSHPAAAPPPPAAAWSVTALSSAAAVLGPWTTTVAGDADAIDMALPPAPGWRYALVALQIRTATDSGGTFFVVDGDRSQATVRLTFGDTVMSPLGVVSSPPDLLEPFVTAPLGLAPGHPPVEMVLAFTVPAKATEMRLEVNGKPAKTIALPPGEAIPPDRIEGIWGKLSGQRLGLRYDDPVTDALCASQHRVMSVRRVRQHEWVFDFPFTDIPATPVKVSADSTVLEASPELAGRRCRLRARLIEGGDLLVLYLGKGPAAAVVYRRLDQ